MRSKSIAAISLISLVCLSGCGVTAKAVGIQNTTQQRTTQNNVASRNTITTTVGVSGGGTIPQAPNQQSALPPNTDKSPNVEAANIPQQFYKDINAKQYDAAFQLLGPDLNADKTQANRKFFTNMKRVTMTGFKDVSSHPGLLHRDYSKFYAVKFYYAILNIDQYNPNLNPMLIGTQYRRFTVVQVTKDGPWLLDEDSDVSPQ